jgi:hypothetical protein
MPKPLLMDLIGLPITTWVISNKVGMPQQQKIVEEIGNDIVYEVNSLVRDIQNK